MGTSAHIAFEVLSALADGEVSRAVQAATMEHLVGCSSCSAAYASIGRLDDLLRQPAVITCESALPILSAASDHEADEGELAVARAHAAGCASCAQALVTFATFDLQLRALPSGTPSARVDRAIASLGGRAAAPAGLRLGLPRAVVAGLATLLLLIGGLYRAIPASAPLATDGGEQRAIVAAVQQVVFNPSTNTLYVLDTSAGAVDARDATTNERKAHIEVGGRPTALALNETANTVFVLDSEQKRVVEIDGSTNTVRGSSTVATAGTPTAISVDPAASKVVVTATETTTGTNAVSVIDTNTKQVETVKDVSVGAVAMVFDSSGDRAVLVSPTQTTLVDSNYKIITTLPGGVSAAFGQGDDRIAVLSAKNGKSLITFAGPRAPIALELAGAPRAITALPDGGFLVLVELGGKSRVSYVAPDGHDYASTDIAALGSDLVYDAKSKKFTLIGRDGVTSADAPSAVLTAVASPSPTVSAPSPTPPPSSEPTSSAQPSATPSASAAPSASATPNVLGVAPSAGPSFVHLQLPGDRAPLLTSKSGDTLWILDDRNGVVSADMATGHMDFVTLLPRGAQITYFAAGRDYVYAIDARAGVLHLIDRAQGTTTTQPMLFIRPVSSVVVGVGDKLWIGLRDLPYLLAFDPLTGRTTNYDLVNAHVSKLAVDGQGRILYADDDRMTVGTYDPAAAILSEVRFDRRGTTTGLVVDADGTLWLSTSAGEIHNVRNKTPHLALSLQRPVTALKVDEAGLAWYLAPLPSGAANYGFARADGSDLVALGGPAASLDFNSAGRVWLADPRGGFYVSRRAE